MNKQDKFHSQAGITTTSVVFIIAIVAILAAAIIFGSGIFSGKKTTEANRDKALAIIQIGENLKSGVDRLMGQNKTLFDAIDTNPAHTSGVNALFAPDGGGATAPSYALANNPSNDGTAAHGDIWLYPHGPIPGMGLSDADELFAVLSISSAVCDEINKKANSISTASASALGDFTSATENTSIRTGWPTILNGRTAGCVHNSSMHNQYFFFQVLVIQ